MIDYSVVFNAILTLLTNILLQHSNTEWTQINDTKHLFIFIVLVWFDNTLSCMYFLWHTSNFNMTWKP